MKLAKAVKVFWFGCKDHRYQVPCPRPGGDVPVCTGFLGLVTNSSPFPSPSFLVWVITHRLTPLTVTFSVFSSFVDRQKIKASLMLVSYSQFFPSHIWVCVFTVHEIVPYTRRARVLYRFLLFWFSLP